MGQILCASVMHRYRGNHELLGLSHFPIPANIRVMSGAPIVVTKKDVKRGAWHYLKPALMILLSLPVLYVLGSGPVFRFLTDVPWCPEAVRSFLREGYEPIWTLSASESTAGKCLRS